MCLFVCVFFPLVHFVKMVHVLKEIKTLYRVFGPWALYLAYVPSQARGTLLDTSPRSTITIKSLYFLNKRLDLAMTFFMKYKLV